MITSTSRTISLLLLASLAACSAGTSGGGDEPGGTGGDTSGNGGSSPGSGGTVFGSLDGEGRKCGDKDINILFVIDRSGSMNCNLPPITESRACEQLAAPVDAGQPTKWGVMTGVLSAALERIVPPSGIHVRAGLSYFSTNDRCGANSAPLVQIADADAAQIGLLRQTLSQGIPAGATPIVGATILAYKHLHEQSPFTGEGHVILLTDGADSCGPDYDAAVGPGDHVADLIMNQAPKALGVGIRTWVIGAPGSEPARGMLSRLAVSGGTQRAEQCDASSPDPAVGDCHYDMTTGKFETALQEALEHIVDVVTCKVT
jgi:hypothetical protein